MSLRSAFLFLVALLVSEAATAVGSTTPFPTPLTAKFPAGSLIYSGSTTGNISVPEDANIFTLSLDAGQTISVNVVRSATLQPTVEVRDPSNNTIATATASAPGQEALIQTVPATTAGAYVFFVQGTAGTTGTYTLKITLNAALEFESHGFEGNDSLGTAQDLNSALLGLGGPVGAARMAVLGHADGGASGPDYYSFGLISAPRTIILHSRRARQ